VLYPTIIDATFYQVRLLVFYTIQTTILIFFGKL
jgi:hypothetical protein